MVDSIFKNEDVIIKEGCLKLKLQKPKFAAEIAPQVKAAFKELLEKHYLKNIIFDLSAVKFMDSTGLNAIVEGHKLCNGLGGKFVLVGVSEDIGHVIKITKLDSVLFICPPITDTDDKSTIVPA